MKNYKLPLVGIALVLLITSCRKEDVRQNSSKATSLSAVTGSWNSLSNWSTVKTNDSTTTYFSQVADSAISAVVTNSGLVLVFKKNGNAIQSLPFEDKSSGTYWYYQISKGLLRIDGNISGASHQNFYGQVFSYFVFTPEQISTLEEKGKTKLDLMQLTYPETLELFR
jgi:hypothetical protein